MSDILSVVQVSVLTYRFRVKLQADNTSCHLLLTDFYHINSSKLTEELTSFVTAEQDTEVPDCLVYLLVGADFSDLTTALAPSLELLSFCPKSAVSSSSVSLQDTAS